MLQDQRFLLACLLTLPWLAAVGPTAPSGGINGSSSADVDTIINTSAWNQVGAVAEGNTTTAAKWVTFVMEQDWNTSALYGSGGKCTSGGVDHTRNLVGAFLEIAR